MPVAVACSVDRRKIRDIHRIRNTGTRTAISLHIYGTDITRTGSSARRYYS